MGKPSDSDTPPAGAGEAAASASLDRAAVALDRRGSGQTGGAYARLRAQADQAAAAADKGDDRAYRLLAEAIRGLLHGR